MDCCVSCRPHLPGAFVGKKSWYQHFQCSQWELFPPSPGWKAVSEPKLHGGQSYPRRWKRNSVGKAAWTDPVGWSRKPLERLEIFQGFLMSFGKIQNIKENLKGYYSRAGYFLGRMYLPLPLCSHSVGYCFHDKKKIERKQTKNPIKQHTSRCVDVLFRAELPTVTFSLHSDQLYISVLIAVHYTNNIPWWGVRDAPIYRYREKHLEGTLLLCSFSKITVGSPLGSMKPAPRHSHGS